MSELVERVAFAIAGDGITDVSDRAAKRAIKAIAEWLDEQRQVDVDGSVHTALSIQLQETTHE